MSSSNPIVISVHSYKGGTGKTITAVNLAVKLAENGKIVTILDMDFGAPSLYTYFSDDLSKETIKLNEVILEDKQITDAIFDASNLLTNPNGRLYAGLADHQSDQTRKMIRRGLKESSRDAGKLLNWIEILGNDPYNSEIIILDTAPGLNFLSVNSVSACDIAIILLRMLNADLTGTKEMINGLHSKLAKKILLAVNQLPPEFLKGQDEQEIRSLVNDYIINSTSNATAYFGGIIANDMDLVRLEAENMLEFLKTGMQKRDIYVLKRESGDFSISLDDLIGNLEELF